MITQEWSSKNKSKAEIEGISFLMRANENVWEKEEMIAWVGGEEGVVQGFQATKERVEWLWYNTSASMLPIPSKQEKASRSFLFISNEH